MRLRHPSTQSQAAAQARLSAYARRLRSGGNFAPAELDALLHHEKIRVAMAKMAAAASVAGQVVVYFEGTGTGTTHDADNTTEARTICADAVATRNLPEDPTWALVEVYPGLHLGTDRAGQCVCGWVFLQ